MLNPWLCLIPTPGKFIEVAFIDEIICDCIVRFLPKKENELFRSLIKFYETKQYKKGIKTADTVLKKFPDHGETLAMKGLILNCMDKKEESFELIKRGLKNDVRSHVCWHVFGLYHRGDRNYKEAIKCYLNALKIDADNSLILKDLSMLQIHMRDFDGFIETRRKLLIQKPTGRQQWVAYGVANFVAGNYSTAFDVIQKYLDTTTERDTGYEQSELLLFHNMCLEAQKKYDSALTHLDIISASVVDRLSWSIKKAELLTLLGDFEQAQQRWLSLVSAQPENYRLHSGLQTAYLELTGDLCLEMFALKRLDLPCTTLNLSDTQRISLIDLYKNKFTKSRAASKIMLTLYRDKDFREALNTFLIKHIRDGVPSVYNDVCALIRQPDPNTPNRYVFVKDSYDFRNHPTTILLMELVEEYLKNLRAFGTFHPEPAVGDEVEVPTALLWTLFLYCHLLEMCGRYSEALTVIEEAIHHTPTALDMLTKKGRILKKCGDLAAAWNVMEECRSLDLQDRYLNNKATKYMLRADNMERAMDTIAMFTRHDGESQQSLFDLQTIWYELEAGESYYRTRQAGPALKKFYAVEKHFLDFVEDQFDFHNFCLRKVSDSLVLHLLLSIYIGLS